MPFHNNSVTLSESEARAHAVTLHRFLSERFEPADVRAIAAYVVERCVRTPAEAITPAPPSVEAVLSLMDRIKPGAVDRANAEIRATSLRGV